MSSTVSNKTWQAVKVRVVTGLQKIVNKTWRLITTHLENIVEILKIKMNVARCTTSYAKSALRALATFVVLDGDCLRCHANLIATKVDTFLIWLADREQNR